MPAEVEGVAVMLASPETRDTGLLGWARVLVAGFEIDGLAVRRRRRDDRLSVTWPERRSRNGEPHPIVSPVDDALRGRVEAAVLAEYLAAARRAGRNRR
jgi:hypothetical protein